MKKILLTAITMFSITTAFAFDLSGTYNCKGHAPGGKEYTDGFLTITKSDNLYDFSWKFAKENSHTTGKGVYNPEDDNTIAVLFTIQKPTPKQTGVIIYKASDNTIKGTAIIDGKTLIGGETCTKK